MEKGKKRLKEKFEAVCNEYAECFQKRMEFTQSWWIKDEVGGLADFNECYTFSLEEMRYVIDEGIERETVLEWFEYHLELSVYGVRCPSLQDWCKGASRISEEEMNSIRDSWRKAQEAKEELERLINELNSINPES